jgi:hypothetical protein
VKFRAQTVTVVFRLNPELAAMHPDARMHDGKTNQDWQPEKHVQRKKSPHVSK